MTSMPAIGELVDDELLAEITADVFTGLFGQDAERPVPAVTDAASDEMRSSVVVSGGTNATVAFRCGHDLVREAAAELFDLPPAAVSRDEMVDVAGEIVNVIGGNVKSLLPGPSALSLPRTGPASSPDGTEVVSVRMQWRGHVLQVEVVPVGSPTD